MIVAERDVCSGLDGSLFYKSLRQTTMNVVQKFCKKLGVLRQSEASIPLWMNRGHQADHLGR